MSSEKHYENYSKTPLRQAILNSGIKAPTDFIDYSLINYGYTVEKTDEVAAFLKKYPFLWEMLAVIKDEIAAYFGNAPVYLEVVYDPEIQGEVSLEVGIATDERPKQAKEKLDRLDYDWWLENMDQAQDKLYITLRRK